MDGNVLTTVKALIFLFYLTKYDVHSAKDCIKCMCEVETGCNPTSCDENGICKYFNMDKIYWTKCGMPMKDFKLCMENFKCAEDCVIKYVNKYTFGCIKNEAPSCKDLARIHRGGHKKCWDKKAIDFAHQVNRCVHENSDGKIQVATTIETENPKDIEDKISISSKKIQVLNYKDEINNQSTVLVIPENSSLGDLMDIQDQVKFPQLKVNDQNALNIDMGNTYKGLILDETNMNPEKIYNNIMNSNDKGVKNASVSSVLETVVDHKISKKHYPSEEKIGEKNITENKYKVKNLKDEDKSKSGENDEDSKDDRENEESDNEDEESNGEENEGGEDEEEEEEEEDEEEDKHKKKKKSKPLDINKIIAKLLKGIIPGTK